MTDTHHLDVTVVIPTHDRIAVVGEAIASVLRQTAQPAEIVVVDDGSSDGTAAMLTRSGVTVLRNTTATGSGEARNRGFRAATTRWVAFLDSDDEWADDHLERLVAAGESAGADLVCSAAVDAFGRARGNVTGRTIELQESDLFFPENLVCTSSVVARRAALERVGGFRTVLRAEDLDLWVRMLAEGPGIALPEVTTWYHQSDRYPTARLDADNRTGTLLVADSFATEPWFTAELRRAVRVRSDWDRARFLLHDGDRSGGAVALLRVVVPPRSWPVLLRLLRFRRQARTRGREALRAWSAKRSAARAAGSVAPPSAVWPHPDAPGS